MKLITGKLELLYLALAIRSLCIGVVVTIMPLYVISMGGDSVIVGFLISAYAIAYAASSLMWGKMSDTFGGKSTLALGMFGFSLVVIVYSVVHDNSSIFFVRLLHGFVDAPYWIVPAALIADMFPQNELGKAMGRVGVFQAVGNIAGPSIAAVLISYGDFSLAFYFSFALSLIAAFLVLFGVNVDKTFHGSSGASSISPNLGGYSKRNLAVANLGYVLRTSFLGIIVSYFIVRTSTILMGHDYLIGPLLTFHFLTFAVVQPLAGKLSDIVKRRRAILLAFVTTGFGFLMLVFASSFFWLLIAIAMVGAGLGQISVSVTTAIMDLAPGGRKGLAAGFQNVGWGIGYFIGSFVGGVLAIYSASAPYVFCVIASMSAILLTFAFYTEKS